MRVNMLNRLLATSLLVIVPDKFSAQVTLLPESTTPTVLSVNSAWFKPLDVKLTSYGGVELQGNETRIRVPDREVNPTNNGREIRPRDKIQVSDDVYLVISARLTTVRTVWDCLVRREMA